MTTFNGIVRYRRRTLVAAAVGWMASLFAIRNGVAPVAATMVGWNIAATLFLGPTLAMLFFDSEVKVRLQAGAGMRAARSSWV